MTPVLTRGIGNASASHFFGQDLAQRVEGAREQVANLVGGRSSQTIFTAGATESNNLVLFGILNQIKGARKKILVSDVEHASVREPANWIADNGLARVEFIPVTSGGFVDPDIVKSLVGPDTLLVSVMAANSETGVINPIHEIADTVHKVGAYFHCDATQYIAREYLNIEHCGIDFVSFSSHKIYGPTGVGALIGNHLSLRLLKPIVHGGDHELGLRSGSLNTAGIVGFGAAAELAFSERTSESLKNANLRNRLVEKLQMCTSGIVENGAISSRLSNTTNIRFIGADADAVLTNIHPVAASNGSACSSGAIEPSKVLLNMGLSHTAASESMRFSIGRFTKEEEIDLAAVHVAKAVERVRNLSRVAV